MVAGRQWQGSSVADGGKEDDDDDVYVVLR